MEDAVQEYLQDYAHHNKIPLSCVLKRFLSSASALNYMGAKEPFKVTFEMVQDEKYFDRLFSDWYERQKNNRTVKN